MQNKPSKPDAPEMVPFAQALALQFPEGGGMCLGAVPTVPRWAQFSPDGTKLLTGGPQAATLCIYGTPKGFAATADEQSCGECAKTAFSSDSRYFMRLGHDGQAVVWDTSFAGDDLLHVFATGEHQPTAATFFGPSRLVMGYAHGLVALMPPIELEEHSPTQPATIFRHSREVTCIKQYGHGRQLVSGDESGVVMVFDQTLSAQTARSHKAHEAAITAAAFSPSGDTVVTADAAGKIVFATLTASAADADTGQKSDAKHLVVQSYTRETDAITSLTFCPKGRFVAVAYRQGGLMLLDWQRAQVSHDFAAQYIPISTQGIMDVTFCPQGTYLVVMPVQGAALMFKLPTLALTSAALVLAVSGNTQQALGVPQADLLAACDDAGVWRFCSYDWMYQGGHPVLQEKLAHLQALVAHQPR